MHRASLLRACGIIVLAGAITFLVCRNGIPILRHDWSLPITPWALHSAFETFYQPWLETGIGAPQAYPATYLFGFVLQPLALLSPTAAIAAFVFFVATIVAVGAASIASALRTSPLGEAGAVLFASLNPWCYTEYVAGHLIMIAAMGMLLCLTAELLRSKPRNAALIGLAALVITQLEFFVFIAFPLAIAFIATRRKAALLALTAAAFPVAYGLITHLESVTSTPYVLQWQRTQSVAPLGALTLGGYMAGYTSVFSSLAIFLACIFVAFSIETFFAIRSRSPIVWIFVISIVALIVVTGTKGPLGAPYSYLVIHVQATGVFRELYDLLAFLLIGYIVALVRFSARSRLASGACAIIAIAITVPWFVSPPYNWFVSNSNVRPLRFPATNSGRVALYPSQQPLSLEGVGEGYDYDLFSQPGRAEPINSFIPTFPQTVALSMGQRGDDHWLRALSVVEVLSRPHLREAIDPRGHTFLLPISPRLPPSHMIAQPFPLLGIVSGDPEIVRIGRSPLGDSIFYGDDTRGGRRAAFFPASGSRLTANPAQGWIDARLTMLRYPQIATRFEGAFTASSSQLLHVHPASKILAWTNGAILSRRGTTIVRPSRHLRWWPLPPMASEVRCLGRCAVVGTGSPPALPDEAPEATLKRIAFSFLAPWLIHASLPPHSTSTLRWNVQFQRSWFVLGAQTLRHVRLDQSVNGWTLPPSSHPQEIWIINFDAAVELILEILSALVIVASVSISILRERAAT